MQNFVDSLPCCQTQEGWYWIFQQWGLETIETFCVMSFPGSTKPSSPLCCSLCGFYKARVIRTVSRSTQRCNTCTFVTRPVTTQSTISKGIGIPWKSSWIQVAMETWLVSMVSWTLCKDFIFFILCLYFLTVARIKWGATAWNFVE